MGDKCAFLSEGCKGSLDLEDGKKWNKWYSPGGSELEASYHGNVLLCGISQSWQSDYKRYSKLFNYV